jgi:steroid delta-isomerase-like uncharacterized protein
LEEGWSSSDPTVVDAALADDFREHPPKRGDSTSTGGRDDLHKTIQGFRDGFSDLHVETIQLVAEGSRVVALSRVTGTHDGTFLGIPASGKTVGVNAIDEFEIRDGRIVEHWGLFDVLGAMQQVGMGPGGPGGQAHG